MATADTVILKRIEMLEAELAQLKKLLGSGSAKQPKKGANRGRSLPRVNEEDFEDAKKSVFKPSLDESI